VIYTYESILLSLTIQKEKETYEKLNEADLNGDKLHLTLLLEDHTRENQISMNK